MADMATLGDDKHSKQLSQEATKKLAYRVLLWPFFFFADQSPFKRLAEILFKRYGDKGRVYYGYAGFKNFCNDLFHGKNRYANWTSMCVELPCDTLFADMPCRFVTVSIARNKTSNQMKCRFILGRSRSDSNTKQLSRYEIDSCSVKTIPELIAELDRINVDASSRVALLEELKSPNHQVG